MLSLTHHPAVFNSIIDFYRTGQVGQACLVIVSYIVDFYRTGQVGQACLVIVSYIVDFYRTGISLWSCIVSYIVDFYYRTGVGQACWSLCLTSLTSTQGQVGQACLVIVSYIVDFYRTDLVVDYIGAGLEPSSQPRLEYIGTILLDLVVNEHDMEKQQRWQKYFGVEGRDMSMQLYSHGYLYSIDATMAMPTCIRSMQHNIAILTYVPSRSTDMAILTIRIPVSLFPRCRTYKDLRDRKLSLFENKFDVIEFAQYFAI
ncbi:hypothetical protein Btru_062518 [Bulinus truncatus]|nr:hypothetical protein Btru_062518 [Bulinus truncatus]